MARPSKYKPEYAEQGYNYCLLGATDVQLADFFDVAESTISKWKLDQPEFSEALKSGKAKSDADVASSLFNRARGYSHPDVKVFMPGGAKEPVIVPITKHYAPDTTACIFWLKNRQPAMWRDRQEIAKSVAPSPEDLDKLTDAELETIIREARV